MLVCIIIIIMKKFGGRRRRRWALAQLGEGHLTATAFVAFNWTSRVDFDFARGVCGTRWWANAVLDLRCHCHKGLLNIGRVLGWCLKEWNSELVGVFLQEANRVCCRRNFNEFINLKTHRSRGRVDDFLCRQITFVAYKKFVYVLTCVTFDFLEPLFHVVEWFLVRAVINDDNAMSAAVVAGSNCSEAFLASGL